MYVRVRVCVRTHACLCVGGARTRVCVFVCVHTFILSFSIDIPLSFVLQFAKLHILRPTDKEKKICYSLDFIPLTLIQHSLKTWLYIIFLA